MFFVVFLVAILLVLVYLLNQVEDYGPATGNRVGAATYSASDARHGIKLAIDASHIGSADVSGVLTLVQPSATDLSLAIPQQSARVIVHDLGFLDKGSFLAKFDTIPGFGEKYVKPYLPSSGFPPNGPVNPREIIDCASLGSQVINPTPFDAIAANADAGFGCIVAHSQRPVQETLSFDWRAATHNLSFSQRALVIVFADPALPVPDGTFESPQSVTVFFAANITIVSPSVTPDQSASGQQAITVPIEPGQHGLKVIWTDNTRKTLQDFFSPLIWLFAGSSLGFVGGFAFAKPRWKGGSDG